MICLLRAGTMSTRDRDWLPHRRILTGSDLMESGDRMMQKGYNGFIKIGICEEKANGAKK